MTLVYKEVAWEHPLISNDETLLLAADGRTHKILMHQKYKPKSRETMFSLPLVSNLINDLILPMNCLTLTVYSIMLMQ